MKLITIEFDQRTKMRARLAVPFDFDTDRLPQLLLQPTAHDLLTRIADQCVEVDGNDYDLDTLMVAGETDDPGDSFDAVEVHREDFEGCSEHYDKNRGDCIACDDVLGIPHI